MPARPLPNDQYFVMETVTTGEGRRLKGNAIYGTVTQPRFHNTIEKALVHCRGLGNGISVSGPHDATDARNLLIADAGGWNYGNPA
jgi:hypothetical protein